MTSIKEKVANISSLIEKQLPDFVVEDNPKFISFLSSYYESQEIKYNSLDLISNLIDYYNIGSYSINDLTQYTNLQSEIANTSDTITVISTHGFPSKNGYISINGEIIFYKEKTNTEFLNCVRGTSAFIFESIPYSQVVYKQGSVASSHVTNSQVVNIAYYFTQEFLRRIKSEISPNLPEVLSKELNLITFLKNVKSFYSSKGSEESHKLLFRILFNDKKVKIRLTPRGSGARADIVNYTGKIDTFSLISGGSDYYYEVDNTGNLVSEPLIQVVGSGTGKKLPGEVVVPSSAQMKVTEMTSAGTITKVEIINEGENYIGPISTRIRPRSFSQDQTIYNEDSNGVTTGTAKVDTWDPGTNELILYDVVGYFKVDDKIIGEGGENPRGFISKAYPVTDINKEGNPSIEIISQDPIIEYPKQYVFRPSSAVFYERISIRCELLPEHSSVTTLDGVNLIELVQSRDTPNNIKGVDLVVTEISRITDNLYEFELQESLNYKDLYLPSSTVVTSAVTNITSSSNSTISVESTFNFPQNNGRLFVNGKIITYESKTATQFLNCNTEESETVNLNINNQVHLYGRKCSTSGQLSYFINGYIDGDKKEKVVFRLYGLPSSPIIEKGGSLYSQNVFELELNTLKLNKTILQSKQYSGGEITEVIIENPGKNYKINDKLIIDNSGNPGNGFTAQISSVKGKNLTQYALSVISDQNCIVFTTNQNHGLQVGDKVKFNQILGNQTIFSIVSNTKFAVENTLNLNTLNLNNLSYITNSRTAVGPIETINISNYGKNYTRLPEVVGVNSQAGSGALIQLNSSKVGNITKFTYDSVGDELIGNKNTKYQIKIPTTAKIINNFVLDSIQVINGGNTYNSVLDKVKVNGIVDPNYEFELIAESGVIRQVNVLRSKSNLTSYPELSIQSNFGNGAVLNPILKRKPLRQGDILTFGSSGSSIKCEVVSFDPKSSTLEYNVISGTISNGDVIYDSLGIAYGTITNISTASAYCKRSPYIKYSSKFLDNLGFISDSSQKIINSDYIQDWSYSITSTRNTKDWKNDVLNNTHVSGFRVFGKNRIENKREFFEAKEEVFNSSVIFKSTLSNLANVNLKQSKSILQKIAIVDASSFAVSDIIYGSFSGSYGIITSISENYIVVNVVSDSKFEFGEYIFKVSIEFILENDNKTNYGISFFNGICQEPFNSYYLTIDNYIPRFLVSSADDIVLQELETPFQVVDTRRIGNIVTLTKDLQPLVPTSKDQLLVSINGVLQAQSAYSVSQNILSFNSITLTSTDVLYVLYHPKLKALTFTGTEDTYTLNYTPTSSCNLVIFANGVYQTHLAPISNFTRTENQIQFSDPITDPSTNLVGWYIDETVTCSIVDIGNINDRKIIDTKEVDLQKLTEYLETNNVKTPKSLYEISKDLIEGTLYIENYDTVYGFDTNFMYSNPEYSNSYVEVLDPIVFNGTSYQFPLKYMDGNSYTPINGKTNLVVNIDGNILDPKKYNVVGSNITFQNLYTSANKCTIIDFYSNYIANTSTSAKGIVLDDLNVVQDSSRKTFNLSDRGVPQYVKNTADIFAVKNQFLLVPNSQSQSLSENKITLQTAPTASDVLQLFYFNRQLSPAKTKNVVLDSWECIDGVQKSWPLTKNGILFTPINVSNLLVCRNGAFQIPGIDYTTSGTNITFDEAPELSDDIVIIYSYNNINQNSYITSFTAIAEVTTVELGLTPPNVYDLLVSRNGVIQNPTEDFTVTGTTLTFTSPVKINESVFIVYAHASEEIQITSAVGSSIELSSAISAGQEDGLVIYVNGTPKFYNKDYTIVNGTTVTLLNGIKVDSESVPFAIKYVTSFIVDDLGDCQNGIKTKFRLFYNQQNLVSSDILGDVDILISRNGIIQYPGTQYTINPERGLVEFSTPLKPTDVVFMVRMYGNSLVTLTETGTNLQYTLSESVPENQKENFVIFASDQWCTEELSAFTFQDTDTVLFNNINTGYQIVLNDGNSFYVDTLNIIDRSSQEISVTNTTVETREDIFDLVKYLFAIKFDTSFKLLDQVHTPFNGSNTKFNLFASEENFLPQGTIENNQYPSESSLIVVKDGKLLEPAVDYTLQGDIKSQIQFAVAPSSSSEISVKSIGSFLKLKTLTSVSGTTFNIQKSDNTDYYPNKDIDRPRKLENQVLIFRNGSIQSPLYDYYIDNNKLVFTSSISSSKLVILDFRGVHSDVSVDSVSAGVSIGDKILISGDPDLKVVSSILSPTVMKVTSYIEKGKTYIINVSGTNFTSFGATNNNVGTTFTATASGVATGIASSVNTKKASGLVVTSNTSGGKVTSFNITSGGSNYEDPVIIRTKGVGYNAKGSATVDTKLGNAVVNSVKIQSQGYNQYAAPVVVSTSYSYVYRQTPVSTSSIQVATKLASSINSTDEIISIANSSRFSSSDIQVVVTSTSGSGATFRPFVSKGKITKIELINGGSNYNEVDISIDVVGGGGSGCVIEPVLNSSGTITSINLRNSGEGYDSYKVIIDSEIIEYTTIDTTQATPRLFGCTRPSNSASHNQDTLVYFDEFI